VAGEITLLSRFNASAAVQLIYCRIPCGSLTPWGLLSAPDQVRTGNVTTNADLGSAQAEVFLSHVSARAIEAVCLPMVDSFDLETLM
jgi:hypothetical protein